jgi:tetratricopeptide (TPR) repeat protein
VPPLDDADEGISLFVERARRVRPDFEVDRDDEATIHEIVRRVDGLPLAIELAASRLSTLSLPDLAARLDDALDLLGTSGSGRTLRSTLDWSYQLLDDRHRVLLRHLAEFADGVDLSGVERVAAATDLPMGGTVELAGLVDASLVQAQLDAEPRYRMLETVRALAKDRQRDVAGEAERARAVMVDWACRTAADIDAVSRTVEEPRADRRLRRELANLRAAHQAALQSNDLDSAIAITVSLDEAAGIRDLPEVWAWAARLAEWPDVDDHPRYAEVLGAAAEGRWLQGDLRTAEDMALRGIELGDPKGRCAHSLAAVSLFRGTPERAASLWREAAPHEPIYLSSAALAAIYSRQLDLAKELNDQAGALAAERGSLSDLGWVHYVAGEMGGEGALAEYEQAVEMAHRAGATFVEGVATVGLAAFLTRAGEDLRALTTYEQLLRYWLGTGNWPQQWTTLRNLAVLLERRGDEDTAATIIASADAATDAAAVLDGSWPAPADTVLPRGEVVVRALAAIERQRQTL